MRNIQAKLIAVMSNTALSGVMMFALTACCWSSADAVESDGDFMRPWESRPYQVQVWVCNDNSPEIAAVLPQIYKEVARRAELADPSAWNVMVDAAPNQWRVRLLESISDEIPSSELPLSEDVAKFDKLIAACVERSDGAIRYRVRELDIQTGQWGLLVDRTCGQSSDLPSELYPAVERVFMPLTRIDRVNDAVRARAVNACLMCDLDDGTVEPIENSPVWVKTVDRLLPIIRRVDKNGDLMDLESIPFTYLTVDKQEGSRLVCQIHSRQRASLGGRSSKRAKKLALVIRPPEDPTTLTLVSRGDDPQPLAGYEIFSRRPGADKDSESEFIGLTDWRGIVEIPPDDEGLRLIFVKHGARALMKLPIIPGLYQNVMTEVPDDEARLNAEGVIQLSLIHI